MKTQIVGFWVGCGRGGGVFELVDKTKSVLGLREGAMFKLVSEPRSGLGWGTGLGKNGGRGTFKLAGGLDQGC